MPPCQTQNSALAGEASVGTEGDPVTATQETPSTLVVMSDDYPLLAQAFDRLTDGLLNTKRTPTLAQVQEPNPFDSLDTHKLQPFLTRCFLKFRDQPDTFTDDSAKVTYMLSYLKGTVLCYVNKKILSIHIHHPCPKITHKLIQ